MAVVNAVLSLIVMVLVLMLMRLARALGHQQREIRARLELAERRVEQLEAAGR